MRPAPRRLSRRALLRGAAAGGAGLLAAYVVGCGESDDGQPTPAATRLTAPTPDEASAPTATARPPAASMGWSRLAPSGVRPPPRRDHSLVSDGRQLFLFGGRASEPLGDLWSFEASVGAWTELTAADGPPARFGHNAVFDGERGRMVVFGGQSRGFFNDVWAFDVAGGEWSQLSTGESGPSPRYGAAGALDPAGRFLVSHGFTDAGRFDDTWGYGLSGEAWTDASPQGQRPLERCLTRAVWDSDAGRLLMFGGQSTGVPFLGDLWQLTPDGWSELTAKPKPSPRNFYAMAFDDAGGRLLLFGGSTESGPVNDLWLFDSASDSWSQLSPEGEAPSARFGQDAVWMPSSGSLLVFGGRDGSQDLNDLWQLALPP